MAIEKGQKYMVNSIDLGMRSVKAVELLVTIMDINHRSDGLELSPGLPSGAFPSDAFFSVVKWFNSEYAAFPKGQYAVNTLSVFESLIRRRIAVLYE